MKIDYFLQQSSNVFADKQLLKVGFIGLLLLSAYNWYELRQLTANEKTHIVPLGATGNLWITGKEASDDYVMVMTRYILKNIGDYTVMTARSQFSEVLRLYHPENYGQAKNRFDAMAEEIEHFQSAASHMEYAAQNIKHDKTQQKIMINVKKYRYLNGVNSGIEQKSILIDYEIRHGQFGIIDILEEKHEA